MREILCLQEQITKKIVLLIMTIIRKILTKEIDDSIRNRPNLCSEGTMTYNELNSPMASSAFDFI